MNLLHGSVIERPLPLRRLPGLGPTEFALERFRPNRQVAMFLPHHSDCPTCLAYGRELSAQAPALDESSAGAVVLLPQVPEAPDAWRELSRVTVAIDRTGEARWAVERAAATLGDGGPAGVVLLDRYGALRAAQFAADADRLAAAGELADWLAFIDQDCGFCTIELPWPD